MSEPRTPSKFRKKPVQIEAMRFFPTPTDGHHLSVWMERSGSPFLIGNALEPDTLRRPDDLTGGRPNAGHYIDPETGDLMIRTLEGDMRATPGDWIIRGVQGEIYPCKPDIFEATYEEDDQ